MYISYWFNLNRGCRNQSMRVKIETNKSFYEEINQPLI